VKLYYTVRELTNRAPELFALKSEARAPFLDRTVMEMALAIPSARKVRGLQTKTGLKAAAEGSVPAEILRRRKRGLSVPIAGWINAGMKDEVDRVFERQRLASEGWLNPVEVHRLLDEHRRGSANHARRLWPLVMFQRWLERLGTAEG